MKHWQIYIFTLVFCLFSSLAVAEEPLFEGELIFPLESWHNHSSNLVECPNGDLLVCFFHGSGERTADDVIIQGARKPKGASSWSERFVMADTPEFPDCNPILFIDPDERLWLVWVAILANRWESALLKYRTSTDYQDEGAPNWNWQANIHPKPEGFVEAMKPEWKRFLDEFPQLIPRLKERVLDELGADEELYYFMEKRASDKMLQRLGWMPRCKPLFLASGKMILPLYTDAFSVCLMAITENGGDTWQTSQPLVGFGNIQASLVQKDDGTIVAMMRENGPRNRIRISTSKDEGMTWSRVGKMKFKNPGSSVEVIRLNNGHWCLMYNDTLDGRHQLKISLSDDEGDTWKWHRYVEKKEPGQGSFSYPSMIQSKDGRIHATYSYHLPDRKKSIKHVVFNEEWIKSN